jgi:FAD/FMN-containing dehydrogenase
MTQVPGDSLLAELAAICGSKGFTRDAGVMAPWLTDWRGRYRGAAAAMVSPETAAEAAAVIAACARHGTPIVPQGGNSGMVGGATPGADGAAILLSTRRMNRIRSIDPAARTVIAEAGVILAHLHEAVAAHGLRFPLTLGGKGSATIGGLVSTNAGGTQVLRHGTMRALVAGIEAVLPDGQLFDGLAPLKKDNRGYDLKHVLTGAEGTLGLVTAATLILVPAITARAVAWVGVDSPEAALTFLRFLEDRHGMALEGFELMPDSCVAKVVTHIPGTRTPLPSPSAWQVLIEMVDDGGDGITAACEATLADALGGGLIGDAVLAKNDREADAFWKIRDSISEAERADGPALQHDVSVPVAAMPAFIAASASDLSARFPGARVASFGHLGDGNVHHHVQPPADVDGAAWIAAHGEDVSSAVYHMVVAMGGSISAEHGIGQSKRAYLAELSDAARIAMLRAIKTGLDPAGLFNPGKLIP